MDFVQPACDYYCRFEHRLEQENYGIMMYSVYQKKLYPLKFKLSASYYINLTVLTASN